MVRSQAKIKIEGWGGGEGVGGWGLVYLRYFLQYWLHSYPTEDCRSTLPIHFLDLISFLYL